VHVRTVPLAVLSPQLGPGDEIATIETLGILAEQLPDLFEILEPLQPFFDGRLLTHVLGPSSTTDGG